MTPKQVIGHYGAGKVAAAAKKLGVSRQTVYAWMENRVPQSWQAWIERDTAGKLRADLVRPSR